MGKKKRPAELKEKEWMNDEMIPAPEINFFNEGIHFRLENEEAARKWIFSVIKKQGLTPGEINYIFCSDEYLHKLNLEYLDHDNYTDIITFDMGEEVKENISGEIFVSIDRVKENASRLGVQFKEELHRVMIHGILHLLGYDDKDEKEKNTMRKKEDECLNLLKNN